MSQLKYPIVVLALLAFSGIADAQQPQTPSQRFRPERQVPPSVHVPDAKTNSLNANELRSPASTSFNFSDTPTSNFRQPQATRRQRVQHPARQVAYLQEQGDSAQRQLLPSELKESDYTRRAPKNPNTPKPAGQFPGPRGKIHQLTTKAPVSSTTQHGIVVDKSQFAVRNGQPAQPIATAAGNTAPAGQVGRIPAAPIRPSATKQVGFTQDEAPAGSTNKTVTSAGFETNSTSIPNNNSVRTVSAESETITPGAAISMSTPSINVQAFGPKSIGINKVATYKVTVSNEGRQEATDLRLSIGLPTTIELQNINISTGHHEVGNNKESARLVWNIDQIPVGVTHTIAINTIARSADPFDFDIKWIAAPKSASTQVTVTQPKLEMKISGPTEVMFGEKATYDVTISNPGTGDAEQVSVMLPEELGGERANIGNVEAGGEKRFKVELLARTAGHLNLAATAVGDGSIKAEALHDILVRKANLAVSIEGPPMKFAGGLGQYMVTVANDGDAPASDVAAVLAMPRGVKYLSGIKNVDDNGNGLKWQIGTLNAGDRKIFKVNCQLDASGSLVFQAGARGTGDLAATNQCQTQVDTVADLTLDVDDPKGPLPTGESVKYKMVIRNRGTRSANSVDVVMQFAEGIEPVKADGLKNRIESGQVIFAPISRIEPGQEIVLHVVAKGMRSGTHIFRGQLTCAESDSREIDEGTTKFFGETLSGASQDLEMPERFNTADATDDLKPNTNDFK